MSSFSKVLKLSFRPKTLFYGLDQLNVLKGGLGDSPVNPKLFGEPCTAEWRNNLSQGA